MNNFSVFWEAVILIMFGTSAGALTAAGYFAVINSIGLINRVAAVTKTTKYIFYYEEIIIAGAIIGNILSLFDIRINLGITGIILLGAFAGMYVGLFVVSLAETTKVMPIFVRRVRIGGGLGIIVLMIALGKAVGHLIYYLILYR